MARIFEYVGEQWLYIYFDVEELHIWKLTQTHAEILKFIIVGGINTLNYYVVYLLLLKLLHIEYMISHITGFIVAFVISYYLNCYFVYRVKPTWRKFISFPITQLVNVSLQTVLLYVLYPG